MTTPLPQSTGDPKMDYNNTVDAVAPLVDAGSNFASPPLDPVPTIIVGVISNLPDPTSNHSVQPPSANSVPVDTIYDDIARQQELDDLINQIDADNAKNGSGCPK